MSKTKTTWARRRWRDRGGTWWWAIGAIVVPVTLLAAAAVIILLLSVSTGGNPQLKIELIRTGLTVGVGTGGVVALVLAGRRQWATEQANRVTEHDATERRLTELYVKAVEQLGSDKPAVRHGALYALERVAQDNPDHRQAVVDVLCAYLRTPFRLPSAPRPLNRRGIHRPLAPSRSPSRGRTASVRHAELPTVSELDDAARQEKEVRLTAQRILATHLRPGDDQQHFTKTFWKGINLDLTGATLIDLDLRSCQINTVAFGEATFTGDARFDAATFTGDAQFRAATFTGNARFDAATFTGDAQFYEATFTGDAQFYAATFVGEAWFNEATFVGDTQSTRQPSIRYLAPWGRVYAYTPPLQLLRIHPGRLDGPSRYRNSHRVAWSRFGHGSFRCRSFSSHGAILIWPRRRARHLSDEGATALVRRGGRGLLRRCAGRRRLMGGRSGRRCGCPGART